MTVEIGGWCSSGSPLLAEVLDRAGFDYVCVDQQHGFDTDLAVALLGIHRARPVVRVATNDAALIGRALDAGAETVIVPLVDDADAAARAAAACRYPPAGVRSFGNNRSRLEGDPQLLVMIETPAGVEAAKQIVSTPGVDGVYLGPADLALGLGTDDVDEALLSVRSACEEAGVACGVHCTSADDARRRIDQGFRMVTVGTDVGLLKAAIANALDSLR